MLCVCIFMFILHSERPFKTIEYRHWLPLIYYMGWAGGRGKRHPWKMSDGYEWIWGVGRKAFQCDLKPIHQFAYKTTSTSSWDSHNGMSLPKMLMASQPLFGYIRMYMLKWEWAGNASKESTYGLLSALAKVSFTLLVCPGNKPSGRLHLWSFWVITWVVINKSHGSGFSLHCFWVVTLEVSWLIKLYNGDFDKFNKFKAINYGKR